MRLDKRKRHERLCALIEETIAEAIANGEECEFEGFAWAIRTRADWAEMLGVSVDCITDLIKEEPIQKTTTQVEGRKIVLLRVGDPAPLTDRETANIMKRIFRKATGRMPTDTDFGRLRGLSEVWPAGAQIDIFKTVLKNWSMYKAGVVLEIDAVIARGEESEHRRHDYPSIPVIRRFPDVAVDLYVMKLQEAGKTPPPSVIALEPALWQHLSSSENECDGPELPEPALSTV